MICLSVVEDCVRVFQEEIARGPRAHPFTSMLMKRHEPTSEDLDGKVLKARSMSALLAPIALLLRLFERSGLLESISLSILLLGSFRDNISLDVSASLVLSAIVASYAILSLLINPSVNRTLYLAMVTPSQHSFLLNKLNSNSFKDVYARMGSALPLVRVLQ